MCGITGWIHWQKNLATERHIVEQMTSRLQKRGPDTEGYHFSGPVALGHRRLVVVDPAGGGQPMTRYKGEHAYTLVYNGELYNTEDIRRELKQRGHQFQAHSDTEVLLV
ncbi:MAG: asparagine synthetase B, partial [Clostridia bacterium]